MNRPRSIRTRRSILGRGTSPLSATLVAALALACSDGGESSTTTDDAGDWHAVEMQELDAAQRAQVYQAQKARSAMFGELISAVSAQVQAGGPGSAIDLCRTRAAEVAAEVGETTGVRIGRTSHKLRNPKNVAPAWAAPLLADHPDADRLALSSDGRLGMTSPIKLAAACMGCHGPKEGLSQEVRDALAKHYPDDQATGFQPGDLRGWFWIEVPPKAE